jgi:hypothetical protein
MRALELSFSGVVVSRVTVPLLLSAPVAGSSSLPSEVMSLIRVPP